MGVGHPRLTGAPQCDCKAHLPLAASAVACGPASSSCPAQLPTIVVVVVVTRPSWSAERLPGAAEGCPEVHACA